MRHVRGISRPHLASEKTPGPLPPEAVLRNLLILALAILFGPLLAMIEDEDLYALGKQM